MVERRAVTRMVFLISRAAPGVNGLASKTRWSGDKINADKEEARMPGTIALSQSALPSKEIAVSSFFEALMAEKMNRH